jgi:N-acetylmuramoyl-L-alanine amidase
MDVQNNKLKGDDGKFVPFEKTANMGGKLNGGKPGFLIIHYTAGGTASGAISTFKDTTPGNRTSAHVVVDHDGSITQMVPFDTVAWHAGASRWKGVQGINDFAVGIEIVNWGKLKKDAAGNWKSWTSASVPADRVVLEEHKHFPGKVEGWEMFDEPQLEASINAARAIVSHYGMSGWDLVGHDDISPLRKVDPGPAFDMDVFRSRVFGEEADSFNNMVFRVNSPSGLNMREKAGVADSRVIKNLADKAEVHVIAQPGSWWLVAEIKGGNDDVTGFVHSNWLIPK